MGELVGIIVGVAVIGLCGCLFVWLGKRMIDGHLSPNMGHHTQENTTEPSWRAMSEAIGRAVVQCGWIWVGCAVAFVISVPVGTALLLVSTVVLIVQIVRAAQLLEPSTH